MRIKNNKSLFTILGVLALGFFVFSAGFSAAKATSGDWENVGPSVLGEDGNWPSLAFNPLTYQPYIAYRDNTNNWRATVKKFSGSLWSDVGIPGMSYASAAYTQIAFNSSGDPYVAYKDNARGGKVSVLEFNGTNWQYVGDEIFSDGSVYYLCLAFNPSTDEPFVAYADASWGSRIVVKKFNGSSWENVGAPGISDGSALSMSFSFNPSTGQPYLAYVDSAGSYEAAVKKYNGSSWEAVGSEGFGPSSVEYVDVAFNPNTSEPYVAFEDETEDEDKVTVMKFNSSSWEYVGNPRFTSEIKKPSIAFNPSTNEPHIAFGDEAYSGKMSVTKWNGSSWEYVGTPGFSEYEAEDGSSLVFDPFTKELFLAFSDEGGSGGADRVVVWKYNKTSSSPSSFAYSAKKTSRKVNFTFQDLNLSTKKKNVAVRINGKKVKISRVRKSGVNTVASGVLNHKNWARGNYDATISFKYKTGKTTRTKTWTAKNALTIE